MAKIAGIKVPKKKAPVRTQFQADEKATGPEPKWDTDRALEFDSDTFDHHLRRSFYYYNYHYSVKQTKKYLVDWLRRHSKLDPKLISRFDRISDRYVPMTPCSLVMAHRAGMPLKDRHMQYLDQSVLNSLALADNAGDSGEPVAASPTQVVERRVTIQDRLQERTSELIGEIEGIYDQVIQGQEVSFKIYDFLTKNTVAQSQLNKFVQVFERRALELAEAMGKKDSQLTESYRHYSKKDFARVGKFIADLLAGIEEYREVKRAVKKAKVRKAPSKEKLISRLKYAKSDPKLRIVSINPVDIVGAQELWVYNIKTRKLGRYLAEQLGQLSVKGTSIVGFDSVKSVAKTLRKPEEQLKEFAKAGKVALRTFIKDIKAVEVALNGRINEDIVLLKVA